MFPAPPFDFSEAAANGSADSSGLRMEDPLAGLRWLYCSMESCCTCQRSKRLGAIEKKRGGQSKTERDKARRKEAKTHRGKLRYTKKGKKRKKRQTDRPTCESERRRQTAESAHLPAIYLTEQPVFPPAYAFSLDNGARKNEERQNRNSFVAVKRVAPTTR